MRIRTSLLATLGATVLATGAALVVMAAPAEAATGQITGLAGKCVDVSSANSADGTQIQLWTCNGTGTHVKPVRAFQDVRWPR